MKRHVKLLAIALAALGSYSVPPALAARANSPGIQPGISNGQMTRVTPVKILGRAEGRPDLIRVLVSDGKVLVIPSVLDALITHRIKADRVILGKSGGTMSPGELYDEITGNCGISWIDLSNKSSGYPVHLDTGFILTELPAVDYSWHGGISGPGYGYTIDQGGALAEDFTWDFLHNSAANETHGTWSGAITAVGSFAVLTDGTVCYSGGPAVSGRL